MARNKQLRLDMLSLIIALLITAFVAWNMGYAQAWDIQEQRRLECGAGWYSTLELVNTLMAERQ